MCNEKIDQLVDEIIEPHAHLQSHGVEELK